MSSDPSDGDGHRPEHGLQRLIFFSDGVIAIAITLLVIEIHPPHLPWQAPDVAYVQALLDLLPNFVGFFISFFVIAAFWAGHHRAFECAEHWHESLTMPNMLFLSSIAALPFFTSFTADNPGARVPVTLYCGWLLVIALLNMRLQRMVTTAPIVDEDVPADRIMLIRQRGASVALGAATGIVVSVIAPVVGQVALASIPLWRRALTAGAARRARRLQNAN
ncbi:DUF1211 domain-containing protein [Sphingomonas koreensis]|nr:DUF1211 domain-containing protein [Sphingomonas koreensis]